MVPSPRLRRVGAKYPDLARPPVPGYLGDLRDREAWLATRAEKSARIAAVLVEAGARRLVLDVGTSVGTTVEALAAGGVRAVGVDVDSEALRLGRARGVRDLVRASGDALPFKEGAFDGLAANHVLEYVAQERAVAEWARVLAPGAPLYLAAVNRLKLLVAEPLPERARRAVTRKLHHGEDVVGKPRTLWGLRRLFRGWSIEDWSQRVLAEPARYGSREGSGLARRAPRWAWRAALPLLPSWILVLRAPRGRTL